MKNTNASRKVAECSYRNGHGTYFALAEVNGKQIKWSLKIENTISAKRRVTELWTTAQALTRSDRELIFEGLTMRLRNRNRVQRLHLLLIS